MQLGAARLMYTVKRDRRRESPYMYSFARILLWGGGGLSKLDANECGPEKAREEREEEDHNPDEMKRLLLQAGKEKGEGGRK